jgi:glutathione S-transferase
MIDHGNKGLVLAESRAIMSYLINEYRAGDQLYPTDAVERAKVDRILFFECGTLYPFQEEALYGCWYGKPVEEAKVKIFQDKLAILDKILEDKKYLAGGMNRTIADLSMLCSLAAAECFPQVDLSKYANIYFWYQNIRSEIPYDTEIVKELEIEILRTILKE